MLEQTEEMLSSLAALRLGAVCVMPQQLAQIAPDAARVETELDTISLVSRVRRVSSESATSFTWGRTGSLLKVRGSVSWPKPLQQKRMNEANFLFHSSDDEQKPPGEARTVLIKSSGSLHLLLHRHE